VTIRLPMSKPLITIAQARDRVRSSVTPLGAELVDIDHALGRVLAGDVQAQGDVPPFPSSAMDGYAVIAGEAGRRLRVIGESRAGAPTDRTLREGEAIRISTGGAVPAGATAVIPQEVVARDGEMIQTEVVIEPGANVRQPGEDMRAGATILSAGTRLGAVEVGAAVAAGAGAVIASRMPKVTVLCTGDELRAPGEPLNPGEIHNSNAPMLTGLARRWGAQTAPAQRLPDDRHATEAGLEAALENSDLLLISGGVSVGPHDHVKPALAALAVREVFWSVSLQPGKPTWFGARDRTFVFGLPGNPVSAVVTFSLFVVPALVALQGASAPVPLDVEAQLGVAVPRNPVREQAVRVTLQRRDGRTVATPTGAQGSHVLSSLLGADALAMVPAGEGELPAGSTVALEPIAW
jgi:molybdopterin molybdotransferase